MEFFNKKEEVIDLKLTQYGRFLLSKGKLKPVFYSFFDDNILYDVADVDLAEDQNESEKRIAETPTMHPQISFSSLEKEFRNNYNKILSGEKSAVDEDLQRTAEKHYALPQPMGTSDFNSEYSPAWSIQFLNGNLSGSAKHISLVEKTGGANTQRIPQLDTLVEVVMTDATDGGTAAQGEDLEEYEDGLADSDFILVSEDEEIFVLLKAEEKNALFQKKNFDIEIFEIVEETQGDKTIETMRQLAFPIMPEQVDSLDFVDEKTPESDINFADYYFDIFVDDEVPDEILCQLDPVNENMGIFSDPRTKLCQDVINQQKKKVFDIYDEEADAPGEIC